MILIFVPWEKCSVISNFNLFMSCNPLIFQVVTSPVQILICPLNPTLCTSLSQHQWLRISFGLEAHEQDGLSAPGCIVESRSVQQVWQRWKDRAPLSSWSPVITIRHLWVYFMLLFKATCYITISCYSSASCHLTSSFRPCFSQSVFFFLMLPALFASSPPLYLHLHITLQRCAAPKGEDISEFLSHILVLCNSGDLLAQPYKPKFPVKGAAVIFLTNWPQFCLYI